MPSSAADAAVREDCDIIMKGGITSGIVYPRAVVALSRRYRFRQIGGASAGAIAATMAAAAELGRRREEQVGVGVGESFRQLDELPTRLGTKLSTLFQPSRETAPAFDVMMVWLEPKHSKISKIIATVRLVVGHAVPLFVAVVLLAMLPALVFDLALIGVHRWWSLAAALLVWLPVALFVGVVAGAVVLAVRANTAVAANGFGLCNGHARRNARSPVPLTDWMDEELRALAGTPPLGAGAPDRPVCFGDLWGDEATVAYRSAFTVKPHDGPAFVDHSRGGAQLPAAERRHLRGLRATDCLVMTTNLSHRRPYRFPFDTQEFFWCETCLGDYFPENVVTQMVGATTTVGDMSVGKHDDGTPIVTSTVCPRHANQPLLYMPLACDIPLVVAARLSLSFPGLISAVPMYAIDWTRSAEHRQVRPVWFSDGGISSNFPMRFFDAAWPTRPTFGINLSDAHPDTPDMVWRPKPGASGRLPRLLPVTTVAGFVSSILDTMQNWNDTVQITMPGFRDRIVVVRQTSDEGGMNLQMPEDVIQRLADRGREAGENIVLGVPAIGLAPFDFATHRWIRYRDAMAGMDELLTGMRERWDDDMAPFVSATDPATHHFEAGANDLEATGAVMDAALELDRLGHPATQGSVPHPIPDLRLVPPL